MLFNQPTDFAADSDNIEWQRSRKQVSIGNQNMKLAKKRLAAQNAEILDENDLRKVEEDVGMDKRD